MKSRIFALICALILLFSALPSAKAQEGDEQRVADALVTLGLVQGAADGSYGLDKFATRAQGAVLLLRLSGEQKEAKSTPSQGYKDLPAWAAEAINHVSARGWLPGMPSGFSPNLLITAEEWCAALLRLSGWTDSDFAAQGPIAFAQHIGLIARACPAGPMTRAWLFETAWDALAYPQKDGKTLLQSLVSRGAVTRSSASALGLLDQELSLREAADRHLSAVFQLNSYSKDSLAELHAHDSSSSGFFISPDGVAVTNCHSIEDVVQAQAQLSTGESYPVESVLWYDAGMDLAVIQVSRTSVKGVECPAFATLELAGSQELRTGDTVYAIGSPLGLGLAANQGNVSAIHNKVPGYTLPCIVSNADISHGSSGGALMNVYGHVVGVTTGAYVKGNNMYLSVPTDSLLELKLPEKGKSLAETSAQIKAEAKAEAIKNS